jgi:hypothetical protein
MSSHDQNKKEPSYPVEKHTLDNHTELKINPAAKHKVNYEDVSKPEGDTLRHKVSEPGSKDAEPSQIKDQVKDETAEPFGLMKSGTSEAKMVTINGRTWIKAHKECKFRPKSLREGMGRMAANLRLGNAYTDDWSQFAV